MKKYLITLSAISIIIFQSCKKTNESLPPIQKENSKFSLVTEDSIVCILDYENLYVINATSGTLIKRLYKSTFDNKNFRSSALVAGNSIFFVNGSQIYSYYKNSYTRKWASEADDSMNVSYARSLLLDNNFLYDVMQGGNYNKIIAVDSGTGETKWYHRWPKNKITSAPTVGNGNIYATNGGKVYSLNKVSGKRNWLITIPMQGGFAALSSVCFINGNIYITSVSDTAYSINGSTGVINWRTYLGNIGGFVYSWNPTYYNGNVLVNAYGKIFALDTATGGIKWTAVVDDYSYDANFSPLTIVNNTIFTTSNQNTTLYAFNASTGTKKWKIPLDQFYYGGSAGPVAFGKYVYVSYVRDFTNHLDKYNASDGSVVWSFNTNVFYSIPFYSPVISINGRVGYSTDSGMQQ